MFSKKITITKQVCDKICGTIGRHPAETGGILGSSDGGRTIDHYYFDASAITTSGTYTPDLAAVNRIIADWNAGGVEFVGPVHSHPYGSTAPSRGDILYAKEIIKVMDVGGRLIMPIVNVSSPPDGRIELYPYVMEKDWFRLRLRRVGMTLDCRPKIASRTKMPEAECFNRIASLYPMDAMRRKTAVCIGCGGNRQFIEELARSGVGNFVLMDGDTVAATNIATQQVYLSEIGWNKAYAIRGRILEINPAARVKAIPRFLDDAITDEEFEALIGAPLLERPEDVLIIGCTDSFHAQARSAALAMKYGTPYLAAQLYKGGLAAEIYFSYPGVTNNGCPRCAMSSRYDAYARGYKNDVTSAGAPIFATTRVNAAKGQIALMLLLYGEDEGCVYNTMLDSVANRNFVMIRMSPQAGTELGLSIFDEAFCRKSDLGFFDETVWIPQTPDNGGDGHPVCPLCGGTGDLLTLKGAIHDTRETGGMQYENN